MVLAAGLHIGRRCDFAQIDRRSERRQRAGFDQLVVAVQIAQIILVPFGGQVGDVAIPVQQVECRIFLAKQIMLVDR
jgi:hypothetical protein